MVGRRNGREGKWKIGTEEAGGTRQAAFISWLAVVFLFLYFFVSPTLGMGV